MSYKVKSTLYFTSLMLAVVTYYNITSNDAIQNTDLAENNIEQVTVDKALN